MPTTFYRQTRSAKSTHLLLLPMLVACLLWFGSPAQTFAAAQASSTESLTQLDAFYFPDENFDAKQFLTNIKNHPAAPIVFGTIVLGLACLATWSPICSVPFKMMRNGSDDIASSKALMKGEDALSLNQMASSTFEALSSSKTKKTMLQQKKQAAQAAERLARHKRMERFVKKAQKHHAPDDLLSNQLKKVNDSETALASLSKKTNPLAITSLTQEAKLNAVKASISYEKWIASVDQPFEDESIAWLAYNLEKKLRRSVVDFRYFEAGLIGKVVNWRLAKLQEKLNKLRHTLKSSALGEMTTQDALEAIRGYDRERARILYEVKSIRKKFKK